MSILRRVSNLVTANIHALLDKAEDPEWLLAQFIRNMETGLAEAKQYAAKAIAAERSLAREFDQNRAAAELWKSKARAALRANREDLARGALLRKREHDDLVRGLEVQQREAQETGAKLRTSLRALEARLAEARRKERALLSRRRAAQARAEVQKAVGVGCMSGSFARFQALEERLAQFEDEITAQTELAQPCAVLEDELDTLEQDRELEEELAALKLSV